MLRCHRTSYVFHSIIGLLANRGDPSGVWQGADPVQNQLCAEVVVEGTTVPCAYVPQAPPSGQTLDFDRMVGYYRMGGSDAPITLEQVADAAACTADAFYIDGEQIILCPSTCDAVQADPAAELDFHIACEADIG